jgi:hypothetical protein
LRTVLGGALQSGLGFGGWGWALNWLAHALFLNPLFLHNNGFGGYGGGYGGGGYGNYSSVAWTHNPVHRLGVAYPNSMLAARFDSGYGRNSYRSQPSGYGSRYSNTPSYPNRDGYSHFAGANYAPRPAGSDYRSAASNYRATANSYRSSESFAPQRATEKFSQPREPRQYYASSSHSKGGGHYSAPKPPHDSAPKSPHFSAPKAPHSSGGHGGGHSGKSKHH